MQLRHGAIYGVGPRWRRLAIGHALCDFQLRLHGVTLRPLLLK
jgi:hypothetical protein